MTHTQHLLDTFNGIRTDRCPVVPKIWLDLAARVTGTEPRAIMEDPARALTVVIDAALAAEEAEGGLPPMVPLPTRKPRR